MLILLVIVLAFAGLFAYVKLRPSSSYSGTQASSSDWQQYKNDKYHIQFSYPASWGQPRMNSESFSKGKIYAIQFITSPFNPDKIMEINMDSEDLVQKVCQKPTKCQIIPPITAAYVQQQKGRFAIKDNSMYATIISAKDRSTMTIYKTVELKSLNISAVQAVYSIKTDKKNCPDNQFQVTDGCIDKSVYTDFGRILDSIKEL